MSGFFGNESAVMSSALRIYDDVTADRWPEQLPLLEGLRGGVGPVTSVYRHDGLVARALLEIQADWNENRSSQSPTTSDLGVREISSAANLWWILSVYADMWALEVSCANLKKPPKAEPAGKR